VFDGRDGVRELSSEQPKPDVRPEEPAATQEPVPPPQKASPAEPASRPEEDVWKEDYEDLIEPEKRPTPHRHRTTPWGAILITFTIVAALVVWTILSPGIMPQQGDTYTRSSIHASWGNYTGYRDIWAGNMTWGVSVSGHATSAGNLSVEITVLVTKVYERPGNWFFKGTAISLKNVSVFIGPLDNATFLASMNSTTEYDYGVSATIPVTFGGTGEYEILIKVRFMVYEVMRIGFIPLESVNVYPVYLDSTVVVT
jgi:hypothetical protein